MADRLGNKIPLRIQTLRDGTVIPLKPEECEQHTKSPAGYLQWHSWAERMERTHIQRQCRGCGLWSIWEPKETSGEKEAPGPLAAALEPGEILTAGSGRQYVIGDLVGASPRADTPCDALEYGGGPPSMSPDGGCRCVVCARCGHHTGNSHQGHWWGTCKVLAERLRASLRPGETLDIGEFMKRTTREFHFCCPEPDGCELETAEPIESGLAGDSTEEGRDG